MWECGASNFSWYCDQEDEEQPPESKQPPPPPRPKSIREAKTIEELKKELQRLLDVANMNPTEENVKAYIDAAQYMADKSSEFSDVWRRVVWKNPELDYSLRRPVNNSAIRTYQASRTSDESRTLSDLAKKTGIFFFFRSDCPYCHQMAPTLKLLQSQYGMEIFPVSLDGKGLPDFPRPRPDNGAATALGVTTVPAMFLGSKTTGNIMPIGFGTLSLTELVERIYILTRTTPGQNF